MKFLLPQGLIALAIFLLFSPASLGSAPLAVPAGPSPESIRALDYLNRHRTAAGLEPMTYSATLESAAAGHAAYLAGNRASGHHQEAGALGFTGASLRDRANGAGYTGGLAEVVAHVGRAEEALDRWMETLYHRIPLLYPGYTEMGYAHAGTEYRANVLLAGPGGASDTVVLWPHPDQIGVPVGWSGREAPDPLRLYPGATGPVGYTITASWGRRPAHLSLTRASLTDSQGKPVPAMHFSPANDQFLRDTVALIPNQPLAPSTTYTVTLEGQVDLGRGVSSYSHTWSFTTGPDGYLALRTWQSNGRVMTVTGQGFREGMRVYLGGLPVQDLTVTNSTSLSFTRPAGYTGRSADLLIVSPTGQEAFWPIAGSPLKAEPGREPFREAEVTVRIGGEAVRVAGLTLPDGTALLPEAELRRLGARPARIDEIGRTYWTAGGRRGSVTAGRAAAEVEGEVLLLPLPVQSLGGTVYLPAAFAEALFAERASQQGSAPVPLGTEPNGAANENAHLGG